MKEKQQLSTSEKINAFNTKKRRIFVDNCCIKKFKILHFDYRKAELLQVFRRNVDFGLYKTKITWYNLTRYLIRLIRVATESLMVKRGCGLFLCI